MRRASKPEQSVNTSMKKESGDQRNLASNGLNPVWNQTFVFDIHCPELALLRFHVEDGDFVGQKTDPFIGQVVYPLDSIRCGIYLGSWSYTLNNSRLPLRASEEPVQRGD